MGAEVGFTAPCVIYPKDKPLLIRFPSVQA